MERSCPVCGDRIIGRADKKFCGDGCRNAYNNALNKDSKKLVRNINNRLRKNYRILEKLNIQDKTKTRRDVLLQQGFSFELITSQYTTQTDSVYNYVYDQGYLQLDNEWILLVKRGSD